MRRVAMACAFGRTHNVKHRFGNSGRVDAVGAQGVVVLVFIFVHGYDKAVQQCVVVERCFSFDTVGVY